MLHLSNKTFNIWIISLVMSLMEKHEIEMEQSPELANDIEAMLQPEYREAGDNSFVQEDPLELLYHSTGDGNFELDRENSERIKELLQPYGDVEEREQKERYFDKRINQFSDISIDEDTGIEYLQFQPYSLDFSPSGEDRISMSRVDVGYNSNSKSYWIGQGVNGDSFLVTEGLLSQGSRERLFLMTGECETIEFYMEGNGLTSIDVQDYNELELPNVMKLSNQVISDLDSAMADTEPTFNIETDPIDQDMSVKTETPREEERIRRRIENTEHKSKFASDPEDVFEKRMSGPLNPLLQVKETTDSGANDLRALFAGSKAVPELEEDTYYGVFFGIKKNSEDEQKKFSQEIGDSKKFARKVLRDQGII